LHFSIRKEQKRDMDQISRDDVARSIASVLQQVFAELHIQHTVTGVAVFVSGDASFLIDVILRDPVSDTTQGVIIVIPPLEAGSMEVVEGSKQYRVLTISRNYLHSIGMHPEQVARLTDEDMTRIAEILIAHHFDSDFDADVVFTARLVLAEKRKE
jgi:hypothetical protein